MLSQQNPYSMENEEVVFFFNERDYPYGCFSSFFISAFSMIFTDVVDEGLTNIWKVDFNCAEKALAYSKALLFKDYELAEYILDEKNPYELKKLSQDFNISNFNEDEWEQKMFDIICEINYQKFKQGQPFLRKRLLQTNDKILAEVSEDEVFGVGIKLENLSFYHFYELPGKNLSGKALMEVRRRILKGE